MLKVLGRMLTQLIQRKDINQLPWILQKITDKHNLRGFHDSVEHGETVRIYRNGRPIGDLVPVPSRAPAWKNPPSTRINLKGLLLSEEIIADREKGR